MLPSASCLHLFRPYFVFPFLLTCNNLFIHVTDCQLLLDHSHYQHSNCSSDWSDYKKHVGGKYASLIIVNHLHIT